MKAQRVFLWAIAILVMLLILGAIIWRLAGENLVRWATTPTRPFVDSPQAPDPDYGSVEMWIARPDIASNPALFAPEGFQPAPRAAAATFYIPPTAFFGRNRWNAPFDDRGTNERLDLFTRFQASVFNGVSEVWAPRYRQATFGTFFAEGPDAEAALVFAYRDVLRAFDAFLSAQPEDRPIILAGHSQGARHLLHLIRDRVAGTPLAARVVAVYAVGWPVAVEADLPLLGLPLCSGQEEAGCLLSWQSWAADTDLPKVIASFAPVRDISGQPLGAARMACLNPLTGSDAAATQDANLGSLVEDRIRPRLTGASCHPSGLLLLDPPPGDIGSYVLPNGNYHAYDYNLFWVNIRADVEARLGAFATARAGAGA
ncbi:MAG: DUF3089 domain-containing protein [Thermaurantiacus sp.]